MQVLKWGKNRRKLTEFNHGKIEDGSGRVVTYIVDDSEFYLAEVIDGMEVFWGTRVTVCCFRCMKRQLKDLGKYHGN